MLTASHLCFGYWFRPEFLDARIGEGHVGIDPIDAPNVYPAGSHVSYEAKTIPGYWIPLPSCVMRDGE